MLTVILKSRSTNILCNIFYSVSFGSEISPVPFLLAALEFDFRWRISMSTQLNNMSR